MAILGGRQFLAAGAPRRLLETALSVLGGRRDTGHPVDWSRKLATVLRELREELAKRGRSGRRNVTDLERGVRRPVAGDPRVPCARLDVPVSALLEEAEID